MSYHGAQPAKTEWRGNKESDLRLDRTGRPGSSAAFAQSIPKVDIVVFGQPSLGGFLQPIIRARKLDVMGGAGRRAIFGPLFAYALLT